MQTIGFATSAVFWGIVTLSLLVVLHEGGHYLAARLFGVRVHEFMVGLPGPAIRFHSKSGTAFGITAIPLGGYVRIAGMEPGPEDDLLGSALHLSATREVREAELASLLSVDADRAATLVATMRDYGAAVVDDDSGVISITTPDAAVLSQDELLIRARSVTYRALPTWKRIVMLAAGVAANLLAAMLVFTIVLSIWGYYKQSMSLERVIPGSAAATAGLKKGDVLVGIEGAVASDWTEFARSVKTHKPGDTVRISVSRDGAERTFTATLDEGEGGGALLGVEVGYEHVTLNPLEAFIESVVWTGLVFEAIRDFFDPRTFKQAVQGARSVVGISVEVANAVKNGPLDWAWLTALLSLSLGVMNLLPIPPLDGGKVVLELVEKAWGRPLDRRVSIGTSLAGMLLLFTFVGYVMYVDIARIVTSG